MYDNKTISDSTLVTRENKPNVMSASTNKPATCAAHNAPGVGT